MRISFGFICGAALLGLALAPAAQAQGGACRDTWINQAYNQLYHRAPQGSGSSGECAITLYGQGHWSSFQDLENKIRQSKASVCRDPWITQAYERLYHRNPEGSGDSGECNAALYGGGHWSSFSDLSNKIVASKRSTAAPARRSASTVFHVDPQLNLRNSQNQIVAPRGGFVIDAGNGRVIAPSAGQVIAGGMGNVIAGGAGNVIAGGAGNYRVQSVGGKVVIHATSVTR